MSVQKITNFKFTKQQRLLKSSDFQTVFNQTSFKVHQSHLLFFVKNAPTPLSNSAIPNLSDHILLQKSRLGLAITKKKIKRANERNRLKRLTREYFRLHQHELLNPVDMVMIVKQSTQELTNGQIVSQLQQGFYQINYQLKKRQKSALPLEVVGQNKTVRGEPVEP